MPGGHGWWSKQQSPVMSVSWPVPAGRWASSGLAKYMWPGRLEIVAELPLTKVGKIDKEALREILAGGDFDD